MDINSPSADENNPHLCCASRVIAYMDALLTSIPDIKAEKDLFHRPLKDGYSQQVMGKHLLSELGKVTATELGLENTQLYTGHCFRRTCATEAANSGANTVDLKRHMGWVQESTALRYIDDTRDRARKMAKFLTGPTATITSSQAMTSTQVQQATHTVDNAGTENTKIYNITCASGAVLNFH
jgi:hypothetical protein